MTSPSNKHEQLTEFINSIKNGNIIKSEPNNGGGIKYFPDVKTKNEDIEVEMVSVSRMKKKEKKWDKNREKILVVGIYDEWFKLFKEIWINSQNCLIKIYDKEDMLIQNKKEKKK